ncbi:hypothetical protein CBM2623_A60028 [Cupriavidus taiwanensis]|nr:hypothetical protein CBM2588_A40091 [Cupriavidus taiwanensis]SPA29680.1 hypothetical protein CBM2623_A60028 [Cupriavidus taiwanensis]SPA46248.1 hypothetical protein CBM2629_A50060 [Cupriavidus taiwanensis]
MPNNLAHWDLEILPGKRESKQWVAQHRDSRRRLLRLATFINDLDELKFISKQ